MKFRFTGYKIYTVAWKDNTNSTELVRDYLSTRVGNSELLKHISQKSLVHAAKIFATLKPVKSFKLESVAALCKLPSPLYYEKTFRIWEKKDIQQQAKRLSQTVVTPQADQLQSRGASLKATVFKSLYNPE
jgi:hypothetical protein